MRWLTLATMVFSLAVLRSATGEETLPVEGTPVIDATNLSEFRMVGKGPKADFSMVAVEGQPFDRAIRVHVAAQPPNVYDVQILTPPTTAPLKKGEHILADLQRPLHGGSRWRRRFWRPHPGRRSIVDGRRRL